MPQTEMFLPLSCDSHIKGSSFAYISDSWSLQPYLNGDSAALSIPAPLQDNHDPSEDRQGAAMWLDGQRQGPLGCSLAPLSLL